MTAEAFGNAFQALTPSEIETLLDRSVHTIYQDGAKLISEGQNHQQIMVILDGEIRVVRKGKDGEEIALSEPLKAGDTVGEMSFIDHLGASATLVAKGDVVVQVIEHELIQELANMDSTFLQRFYHSILFTVIKRLRAIDTKMAF